MKNNVLENIDEEIPNCPYCGIRLIKIIYGMPTEEIIEKSKREEVILGGCIIEENHPEYFCNRCKRNYTKDLKIYDDSINKSEKINYYKISKSDFLKLNEDNLMFITNPGRMGDEDGITFIIKNDRDFTVYRIDGWMYKKEKGDISLKDVLIKFPKWQDTWKNINKDNYKGKYKYLYMGFGNGLSIDNSIYNEFEPYLKKLVNDCLDDYSLVYSAWIDAFMEMVNEKGYILKN